MLPPRATQAYGKTKGTLSLAWIGVRVRAGVSVRVRIGIRIGVGVEVRGIASYNFTLYFLY